MTKTMRATLMLAAVCGVLQSTGCVSTKSQCADGGCGAGGGSHSGGLLGDGPSVQQRFNSCVDPCWPERYAFQAREIALSPFANQAANGQAIDQTIFNGDFESGTDKLTPGGLDKLDTIARRRPVDGRIYVQTSRDISYDPAKRADYAKTKSTLDGARADAVQGYLAASTAGRRLNFEVAITDPQDQRLPVAGPANAVRGYPLQFRSGLAGIAGSGFAGGAGGVNFNSNVTGGQIGAFGGNNGPTGSAQTGNLSSGVPQTGGVNTTGR